MALGDVDLDQILCHQETRAVGEDNVVTLDRVVPQVSKQPGRRTCAGLAGLYRTSNTPLKRQMYLMWGLGLQFTLKPDKHMLASLEYAQGIEDNLGLVLKLGYAW